MRILLACLLALLLLPSSQATLAGVSRCEAWLGRATGDAPLGRCEQTEPLKVTLQLGTRPDPEACGGLEPGGDSTLTTVVPSQGTLLRFTLKREFIGTWGGFEFFYVRVDGQVVFLRSNFNTWCLARLTHGVEIPLLAGLHTVEFGVHQAHGHTPFYAEVTDLGS